MRAKYVIAILCTFAIIISVSSYASYGGDGRDNDKCFDFVYPISYMMPDGSTITVENEGDWGEIKDWYEANPDVKEKPELQYPVDIIFKDGTIKTINNEEELKSAYEYCWDKDEGRDKDKCFKFVYPITYIMPDGSTITVENEDDWGEIKDWYEANPDVKEKPELQYPVDIIFKDGTIKTINNEEELKSAYEYCWDKDEGRDKDKCFKFVYPITYIMPDGSTITVENEDDWGEIKDWYEANPDVKEKPELQYPVDIIFKDGTIKTINNEEELKSAYECCWDKDDDDDDDKDGKLNKAGRGRNRIRDRIRTYLEILRARLRERLTRE